MIFFLLLLLLPAGAGGRTGVQCAPSMQDYQLLIYFYYTRYTFCDFLMGPDRASVACLPCTSPQHF